MNLDANTRERIAGLIEANSVMLFMKGSPDAPGCGFSAQVTQLLSGLMPDYGTFDVLNDPDVRGGIKEFSDWPTIPQLYIKGEFVGGCDIVKEMYSTGELHQMLGLDVPSVTIPTIKIGEAAVESILAAQAQSEHKGLHIMIDASFQHQLGFGPEQPGDVKVETSGLTILLDRDSAARADGLMIDMAPGPDGQQGLAVSNPNSPDSASGSVEQMSVEELKALRDSGEAFQFYDVRTEEEYARANLGATLVDESVAAQIEKLPKDTKLVFHCHHGGRSQAACEHFAGLGFTNTHNVAGGIDAWSLQIDNSVPRY